MDRPSTWDDNFRTEFHIAQAHRGDADFHGVLCDHALIMLEALQHQPQRGGKTHFALGMQLGKVHCYWIALLRSKVAKEHSETLKDIANLVARSSQLLVALITEDKRCTMKELTESEELEAIAGMHTTMGLLCKGLLDFFRNYVASLCHLYQTQFGGRKPAKLTEARYWVIFNAVALGRMLDNVLALQ